MERGMGVSFAALPEVPAVFELDSLPAAAGSLVAGVVDTRLECDRLKDCESVTHPVSKTGDSRFESWVPALEGKRQHIKALR